MTMATKLRLMIGDSIGQRDGAPMGGVRQPEDRKDLSGMNRWIVRHGYLNRHRRRRRATHPRQECRSASASGVAGWPVSTMIVSFGSG